MFRICPSAAFLAGISGLTSIGAMAQTDGRPAIEFVLPVDCRIGQTCFIQNYVDVDPTRRFRDYECFGISYDGHKGTDFRLPDWASVEAGVDVLAAADGIVKGFRGGETDGLFLNDGEEAVDGKECGNGVVLDHGEGWETQYCHLKKDSLTVYRGKEVKAGDKIGLVGLSGKTEFAHLHFESRFKGKTIDPFTGAAALDGCDAEKFPLWTQEDLNQLDYTPTHVLNQGFANVEPTREGIENGSYRDLGLTTDAPLLAYYVRIIGLHNGDTQELTILGPDGTELVVSEKTHEDGRKAEYNSYIGKRRPETGWPTGTYEGRYQLIRGGRILLEETLELNISGAS